MGVCFFLLQFYQYIRKYLSLYPDTAEMDIPLFEDFDLNKDGVVSFDEWQMYLDRHQEVRTVISWCTFRVASVGVVSPLFGSLFPLFLVLFALSSSIRCFTNRCKA